MTDHHLHLSPQGLASPDLRRGGGSGTTGLSWIGGIMRSSTLLGMLVAALPFLVLLGAVLYTTEGDFTYTLDDPYIHLALARNVWAGHYGINMGEASAPSSSILWPFLLAPFAALPSVFEYAPLFINAAVLLGSAIVLRRIFGDLGSLPSLAVAMVILLGFNVYGLAFNGMEHNLQILLVLVIAWGLLDGERLAFGPGFRLVFLASAVLLPLVRYEGLAISLPVLAYMIWKGDRRQAPAALVLTVAGVALFSLFLYVHGLGFLPSSILAKSANFGKAALLRNVVANVAAYGLFLLVVFAYCAFIWRRHRALAVLLLSVTALHYVFGQRGWYGRYEVYYVLFMAVFMLRTALQRFPGRWYAAFLLPLGFASLGFATLSSPLGAANIRDQQAQMAEIARRLDGGVAVNDLGLVALRSGHYVLDLWGLGSIEALNNRRSGAGPEWIARLMAEKGVTYAMVYDDWFPERPSNWIKAGELKTLGLLVTPASDRVAFYATSDEAAERLRAVLRRYRAEDASPKFEISVTR